MKNTDIKVGDEYVFEGDGNTYKVSMVGEFFVWITGHSIKRDKWVKDNFLCHFSPVEQKYMCVMRKEDKQKYYDHKITNDSIELSDRIGEVGYHFSMVTINHYLSEGYVFSTSEYFMQKFPPPIEDVVFVKGYKYVHKELIDLVVLCTGKGEKEKHFAGTGLGGGNYKAGDHCNFWIKSEFKPLTK